MGDYPEERVDEREKLIQDLELKVGEQLKRLFMLEDRKEQQKVENRSFDRQTMLNIYKLFKDGVLETLEFPISIGKEAVVFCGITGDRFGGADAAVKVYNMSNAVFKKQFLKYIQGDPRFKSIRRGHRNMIPIWVRKEAKNLMRLADAGVPVPRLFGFHGNVLVMDYIGDEVSPAPLLHECGEVPMPATGEKVLAALEGIHRRAALVHADFSEFNLLFHEEEVVVIDVGQSVVFDHPMADEFLQRDIKNTARFLNRLGYEVTPEEVMERTGPLPDEDEQTEEDDDDGEEGEEAEGLRAEV